MENALPSGFEAGFDGMEMGWRDGRECARWPPHPNPLPKGRGDRLCSILNIALVFSLAHWGEGRGEGRCLLHTQHQRPTHLPFSALHLLAADAPDPAALAIVQLPAAIFKLAAAIVICLRRSSFTSRCQPSSRESSYLAHGQGYKRR